MHELVSKQEAAELSSDACVGLLSDALAGEQVGGTDNWVMHSEWEAELSCDA